MPDPKSDPVPDLEALLSLEPILSDPIKVEFGGQSAYVMLREVPNDMKNRLKAAAIQHVEDDRVRREKESGNEWREVSTDLDVLKAEEQDLRILHAAMLDPKTKGPAVSLETLRFHLGSNLQEHLGQKYAEFEQGINPDGATEELIESLIEDVKKNADLAWLWTQYGSLTALRCVQYLVARQEQFQIELSSGISSGETQPSSKPKS